MQYAVYWRRLAVGNLSLCLSVRLICRSVQEEHMQMKAEEERKRALKKKRKQQLCARNRSIRQQKRAARQAHEAKELACEERALVQCCDELARMQMMEDSVHDAAALRCLQRPSLSCLVSQVCCIVHGPRD